MEGKLMRMRLKQEKMAGRRKNGGEKKLGSEGRKEGGIRFRKGGKLTRICVGGGKTKEEKERVQNEPEGENEGKERRERKEQEKLLFRKGGKHERKE